MEPAYVYRLKESLALLRRIHHATAKKRPVPNSRRGEQEISLPSLKLSLWDQVGKGEACQQLCWLQSITFTTKARIIGPEN